MKSDRYKHLLVLLLAILKTHWVIYKITQKNPAIQEPECENGSSTLANVRGSNVRFNGGRADFGPEFEGGEVGFVDLAVSATEISCTTL